MNRKRARGLMLELSRRIWLKEHGTFRGFGKVSKSYRDTWRLRDYKRTGGYKLAWNSYSMIALREIYGM